MILTVAAAEGGEFSPLRLNQTSILVGGGERTFVGVSGADERAKQSDIET